MKIGTKIEPVLVNPTAVEVQLTAVSRIPWQIYISEFSTNGRSIYTYITLTPGGVTSPDAIVFNPPTLVSGKLERELQWQPSRTTTQDGGRRTTTAVELAAPS